MKKRGSGHYLGLFCVGLIGLAVFVVSVTLSLTFFQGIAPVDKPWFPYFGLSLTEFGFLCWLGAFLWVKFHGFHTAVEFIMVVASLGGIVATAGVELFSLMPYTSIDVHAPFIANVVGILLTGIFLANIVSVFVGVVALFTESNPGWFRGGTERNAIAQTHEQTGYYVEAQRGEPARPLASSHRHDQPKEAPANLDSTGQIEVPQIEQPKARALKPMPRMKNPQPVSRNPERGILSEGVSLLTQRLKSSITSGRTVGRVRGQTNQITEENM